MPKQPPGSDRPAVSQLTIYALFAAALLLSSAFSSLGNETGYNAFPLTGSDAGKMG